MPGPALVDQWGPAPDPRYDPWTRATEQGGAAPLHGVTVTVPGGVPVPLVLARESSQVVTRDINLGSRWTADLTVVRTPDQPTYDLVTTPGAIFHVAHGWDYGGGQSEVRPFGRYRLTSRPPRDRLAPIQLSLADDWVALSWARFVEERTVSAGTGRAAAIAALVTEALPGVEVVVRATGGVLGDDITESRDRDALIMTLAREGGLVVAFDEAGRFVIDTAPRLASAPAASFVDGPRATILTLSTEQTLTSPYNALIVEEGAGFDAVRIQIANTDHPLHRNRLGVVVPAFATAKTAETQAQADAYAKTTLTRLAGGDEKVRVTSWGLDLDPGATFETYQAATWTDPALSGLWLAERVERDLLTVAVTVTGRSNTFVLTEEIS